MASKVLERIFVEGFLSRLGPEYAILEDRESPDFLVFDGQERYGLEVVQIFRDHSQTGSLGKAAESRRAQYLSKLASNYYSKYGLPLVVKAHIPDRFSLDISTVVDRLKVERSAAPGTRTQFEMKGATFYLTSLPSTMASYSRWLCVNNSIGWRRWLTAADIEPVIADKASKLLNYRAAVARVELLLVIDAKYTSGMIRWLDNAPSPSAQGFDAVYLYVHPKKVIRLS